MGTSVSSLQILGVPEETVRVALPGALVGTWSERFVTACPELTFRTLERKGSALSKKLDCTLLSVSMFDGDTLSLVLFREGKRLTRHVVDPEYGKNIEGNPKLFCSALDLPEELAPKLKRLFAACLSQEEKLSILHDLLGAPLFIRYGDEEDGYLPEGPVKADSGPLEKWAKEHPEPPKIKNQCKAELIQEIPDLDWYTEPGYNATIFRNVDHADEEQAEMFGCKVGDVVGTCCSGGYWAHRQTDGRLEVTPLTDPDPAEMYAALHKQPPEPEYVSADYGYTHLGDRLVTIDHIYQKDKFGIRQREQTVIVHDTAGILPCPLALALNGSPAVAHDPLQLLPDGGFLVAVAPLEDDSCPPVQIRKPALVRYEPDGTQKWIFWGAEQIIQVTEDRIYALTKRQLDFSCQLFVLDTDGTLIAQSSDVCPCNAEIYILGGTPYVLESRGWHEDDLLHRLTPDLWSDGDISVPEMSKLSVSPDGTQLYAAGYESGMRVIDTDSLCVIHELRQKSTFSCPVMDSQRRLWMCGNGYFECYTPELKCISRHRLKGEVVFTHQNDNGQVCAVTFQRSKYIVRVYRFCDSTPAKNKM